MNRSLPIQIAVILAAGSLLYFVSPVEPGPTLLVVAPLCGALLGAVIAKRRPKTGVAIGFFIPLLVIALLAAIVIWLLLHMRLPT